jgi:hypothetical protein
VFRKLAAKHFEQLYGRVFRTLYTKIRFMYSQKYKLRGLVPFSYIHVSVSDSYIPRIDNRQIDPGTL